MGKAIVLIERAKDGLFGLHTSNLKDAIIIGSGKTVAEAKEDFMVCYQELLACYEGQEVPERLRDLEFEYKFDLASVLDYFQVFNKTAVSKDLGINPKLFHQYARGQYVSKERCAQIETYFHQLGQELCSFSMA